MDNGNVDYTENKIMWKPKQKCRMNQFRSFVNEKCGTNFANYQQLWDWSINRYDEFWGLFWEFSDIIASQPYTHVVDSDASIATNPSWFDGARLNYAENILRFNDDKVAVYTTGEGQTTKQYTHHELRQLVAKYATALKKLGVKKGDRVAGYIPNCLEALLCLLACASFGAIWSSTSPDFGVMGVLNRFRQISPKVIISVDAVRYKGKVFNHLEKVTEVVESMKCVQHVIIIPFVDKEENITINEIPNSMFLSTALNVADVELTFEQLPFNHPLVILYSSGTTGPPKCLVHSTGGTLIQHMKEHLLHGNMSRDDTLIYFTTTGWMMWNWLIGGLSSGGAIVLYDGSPFHPTFNMAWKLVQQLHITILGTSAKWLSEIEQRNVCPCDGEVDSLHTILSTGSPLGAHQYDFVYEKIKQDLLLGSISGGTDIISCFMGQNTSLPVHRGEIQAANLGMAIKCYNEQGREVFDERGELVCTVPFPCMPTQFWNDEDGKLYKAAYFNKFPGVWAHGDFCMFNSSTRGIVMLGRSDATLNPNGVRFGTAELYRVLELTFPDSIIDSLAVSQKSHDGSKERVLLFVVLHDDQKLTNELRKKINIEIRSNLTPRHVPNMILQVSDIPYTISGKKVEVAVSKILSGQKVKDGSMLKNPESLDCYRHVEAIQNY